MKMFFEKVLKFTFGLIMTITVIFITLMFLSMVFRVFLC